MSRLVVTRRAGEAVRIGPDIVVRLGRPGPGGECRLVIEAPRSVAIVREELLGRGGDASAVHAARRR